jgi:very-short-patch-repair endonuclease
LYQGEFMDNLVVMCVVALVVGILIAFKLMMAQRGEPVGIVSRGVLFSAAERSFLGVLEQALDSRYRVFAKVHLGDLVKPDIALDAGRRTAALNRINRNHVDFVVCTASELALVGVLELDGPLHGREERAARDEFVTQALAVAGIPVLRFPPKKGYTVQEVRSRLAEMILANTKSGVVSAAQGGFATVSPALAARLENPMAADA